MTLVFDGDCAFCSTSARWLVRWAPTTASVVPWQRTDLAALGLTADQCTDAVQWVDGDRHASGAAAIAAHLRSSRVWWRIVGRALGSRAGLVVAEPAYRWVARNRYRLPGGTPACRLDD
ncbi:MAG: DCC1-like thiol-disulfide oxidoreductase family protein [Nocardioides sp.]